MTDAALILGYEAMRGLRGADVAVETPLETHAGVRLADEVFVVAILRAGLGLVDGFLRLVPEARVGHLGMYRDEEALRPVGYYENIPSGVEDAEVFVVDPMLATGGSRRAGDRADEARGRAAAALRLPGRGARGRRRAAGRRTPTCRSRPPRSTASWTRTATSAPGWATRATASSAPTAEVCHATNRLFAQAPECGGPSWLMQCPECKLTCRRRRPIAGRRRC